MNQLVKIKLIFQWLDHCVNTFAYQIVKIKYQEKRSEVHKAMQRF